MNLPRPISPASAKSAEKALLDVLTALLKAAVDESASADVFLRMPEIRALCDDAGALALAAERIRNRTGA